METSASLFRENVRISDSNLMEICQIIITLILIVEVPLVQSLISILKCKKRCLLMNIHVTRFRENVSDTGQREESQ